MIEKEDLRIVFMGTPEFAVESLKALVENGYNVTAVITMPDKPAGRGYQLQQSAVKKYAIEKGLPVLQPEKLKDEVFLNALKALHADLQIVVAFRMLPEVVWNMPPLGTFNLHGSLLPQYRGAAPINWAIINGEKETGVTTFFLTKEIDTGEIIFQDRIPIGENENAGEIHDKLMHTGAALVVKTVDAICKGNYQTTVQNEFISDPALLKTAPKIFKETCRINWNESSKDIFNLIRGLSPYPGAWAELISSDNKSLAVKIYKGEKITAMHKHSPGSIVTDGKSYLDVAVKDGYIRILKLQLPGKKAMEVPELLRGHKLEGYKFE